MPGQSQIHTREHAMPKAPPPNWIVKSETEQGPLNSEQVSALAQASNLAEADVRALSQTLAYPVSNRFFPRGVIKVVKQMNKAPSELEKLIKELRHAEARIKQSVALYSQIEVRFPAIERGISDPNIMYRKDLDVALLNVEQINRSLARSSKKHGARFTGDPDKRLNRDERRIAVLSAIFDTWHAAGREVNVSTIGSSSERTGPLVDFTNSVVRCLTDPAIDLNGETIWSDIKKWRNRQRSQDTSVLITDR